MSEPDVCTSWSVVIESSLRSLLFDTSIMLYIVLTLI